MKLYEYYLQISTSNDMEKWIHETIGNSFHLQYKCIGKVDAEAAIDRLREAGFEIDYIRRCAYRSFEDIT